MTAAPMTRAEAVRQVHRLWITGDPDVAPTAEQIVDTVIDALGLREEVGMLWPDAAATRYVTEWEPRD